MAIGKYSRVDGRKSSSYCSTVTVAVFVALCLVGTWMFMSSSGVPVENSDLSSQVQNTDELQQNPTRSTSKQSEDSAIDSNKDDNEEQKKYPENNEEEKSVTKSTDGIAESESSANENQEESHLKENADAASESNEEKKAEGENDGNREDSELNSGNGESKEGGETNKNEQTESAEGEKFKDQNGSDNNSGSEENDHTSNEDSTKSIKSESSSESTIQNGAWSTQAAESEKEKSQESSESEGQEEYYWKVCNTTAGPDYIPCLDNWQAIMKLRSRKHYEHRERHCPDEAPTCLVPLPEGYKRSISWPNSRDKIWYHNVPHTKLAEVKGHQNWVKVTGEYLTFPGGGTQFKNGALHYIDFIQSSVPDIAWGKRTHVILDVGCGVASFGGYLFERDVLAMSFAPKDEHEAQVQFALERGIPAILNVMGSKRLPFPGSIFDVVHCARCRVPWHAEGGKLLLELNRVLRPGGYFVWSATPVYQKLPEDVSIWKEMSKLTEKMCWELVTINEDKVNQVGAAIYRKPVSNKCYDKRSKSEPPLCEESDDPNAAWNIPLQACMHRVPEDASKRGAQWPEQWPKRLETAPYWLENAPVGVYGKAATDDFVEDSKHWKSVVSNSYLSEVGINWSNVRNVMDMRAVYGGFAAALKDLKVWVMNVVPLHSADTLAIVYERGLFGMYHDWCESFNTYPRTYDLLHADHLFSTIRKRCNIVTVFAEVDRILRPEGNLLVRDDAATIKEVEKMARSLNWDVRATNVDDKEGFICFQKAFWRPNATETIEAAIL